VHTHSYDLLQSPYPHSRASHHQPRSHTSVSGDGCVGHPAFSPVSPALGAGYAGDQALGLSHAHACAPGHGQMHDDTQLLITPTPLAIAFASAVGDVSASCGIPGSNPVLPPYDREEGHVWEDQSMYAHPHAQLPALAAHAYLPGTRSLVAFAPVAQPVPDVAPAQPSFTGTGNAMSMVQRPVLGSMLVTSVHQQKPGASALGQPRFTLSPHPPTSYFLVMELRLW
jgi:hypothetical protein